MLKKLPRFLKWGFAVMAILGIFDLTTFDYTFQSSPYSLPPSPMIAFRITGNEGDQRYFPNGQDSLHGFAIVQQLAVNDPQLQQELLSALNSRLSYGFTGARCFEPGMAVRFGQGDDTVDALICLSCEHIYFFKGNDYAVRNLTSIGKARLNALYPRMFPGHSIGESDEDMRKVTELRDKERSRLEEEKYKVLDSATQSATAPAN